ncbi:MAG: hypothetical protein ACJ8DZ_09485 [Allosphingosinicella sp.]
MRQDRDEKTARRPWTAPRARKVGADAASQNPSSGVDGSGLS